MTRRRGRRRGPDPLALALAGSAAVLAVLAFVAVLHALGLALILAGVGGGGYVLGRRRVAVPGRRVAPPPMFPVAMAPPCRHCSAGQCGRCNGIGPCACPHNRGGRPASAPPITPADLAALRRERDDLARHVAALGADRGRADALAADVARLAAELADARESAEMAWDAAAAAVPPRPPAEPEESPLLAAMLADPRSGVRRLGPG